jgi:hypothetical protein
MEAHGHSDAEDTLRRLEERLDRASARAEELIAEAARAAGKPPPAGWQVPGEEAGNGARPGDLELLVQVVQSLRELIPAELQRRLAEALREVLLAVRALIDWYLERMDHGRAEPAEVQDIPIL